MLTERIIKIVCQIWFKKIKRKMSQINFIINVLTFRRFSINKRVTILKVNMNNYIIMANLYLSSLEPPFYDGLMLRF